MSVTYLTTPITEARRDYPRPGSGMTREGYTKTSGAPSSIMIRLQGEKRWRRLMVWQFSNLGTLFVRLGKVPHVVREEDLPTIQEVGQKASSAHAKKKMKSRFPYIAYLVHTHRAGGRRDSEPVYVLGTTTRSDEGIVGWDLRIRPLRLGKGPYTAVVSPDDVEETP